MPFNPVTGQFEDEEVNEVVLEAIQTLLNDREFIIGMANKMSPLVHRGGIGDAPKDGSQYARQDGSWSVVTGGGGGGGTWGSITGTLADQTDLQTALDAKQNILTEGAFVDGDKTKLDGIETAADVTDAANVQTALGSLDVADIGDVTITTIASGEILKWNGTGWVNNTLAEADIQDIPAEGAFVDGDKTKLDGIETSADVTDATNVTTALGSIGISAHSDVDTDKSKTPADGDVLTFDGTDWNAEAPAGGGGGQSLYTYVLDAAGNGDYTDFSTAVAALSAGDSLYIRAGTYTETGGLTCTTDGITLIGESPYSSKIVLNSATETLFSGADCTFKNLYFENQSTGYFTFAGDNTELTSCRIILSGTAGLYKFGFNSDGGVMHHNYIESTVTSVQARLIRFGGNSPRVSDNYFLLANGSNSTSLGAIYGTASDMMFLNNYCDVTATSVSDSIFVEARGVITGNFIQGDGTNCVGINANGSYSVISNNIVTDCAKGIDTGGSYLQVNGNVIQGANIAIGIEVLGNNTTLNSNVLKISSTGTAINIGANDNNTVIGNTVDTASVGVSITSGGTNNVIIGNAFDAVTTDISDAGTGTLSITATDSDPLNTS